MINTKEDGLAAIHIAADRGYLDALKTLIDAGADINIKTDDDDTALHLGNCTCFVCVMNILTVYFISLYSRSSESGAIFD